jgi:2-oxoglutarate dehydrogenase E2 component (dihydrolipoamide succinyltransferase)
MSLFEIKMPKLGESITEGTLVSWSVKAGDSIEEDDVLFEVTTAKVNAEVPSPVAGTIQEILFQEGDTVEVGTVVARVNLEGGELVVEEAPKVEVAEVVESTPSPVVENVKQEAKWYSPAVLNTAKEAGLAVTELEKIPGTGYQGRVSKKDVSDYLASLKSGGKAFSTVDVPAKKLLPVQPPMPVFNASPVEATAETSVVDMDPVARIIAERMVASKHTSPHVTTVVEVDVTKLVQWRSKVKDTFLQQEGISLNYLPVIAEATAKALKEFPKVNASVVGNQFVLKKNINLGIAVSLDDGNLVVPVIHHADKQNIAGLAHSIDTLAKKARSNKLKMEEIEGGTFTITNFGTFRNIIGTPIINQPEVAILGVGYIEKKPAVIETPEGDVIAIRHKMYLSLSYDHRIINGALGGAFVKRIADYLENWEG